MSDKFPCPEHAIPLLNKMVDEIKGPVPLRFALFLGAGASISSKIIGANEMIAHFKETIYKRYKLESKFSVENDRAWNKWFKDQPWHSPKVNPYSTLFEECYDKEFKRRNYVESLVEQAEFSFGYLALANLLQHNYFDTIITTNFDDLVYQTCTTFTPVRPVVYALGGFISELHTGKNRPRIIKIHGDFLYAKLKNTGRELEEQDPNMEAAIKEIFKFYDGVIVVGYSGGDKSVMQLLHKNLNKDKALYWCHRSGDTVSRSVQKLVKDKDGDLVEIDSFDELMDHIRKELNITNQQMLINHGTHLQRVVQLLVKYEDDSTLDFSNDFSRLFGLPITTIEANSYIKQGKIAEAINSVKKILKLDSKNALAHLIMGNLLIQNNKNVDLAEKHLKRAIVLQPENSDAYYNLGFLFHYMKKNLIEAEKYYLKTVEINPASGETYYHLANLLESVDRFDEAIIYAKKALENNITTVNVFFLLANLHKRIGRKKETGYFLDKAREEIENNEWYSWACFYSIQGNTDESIKYLRRAIKNFPEYKKNAKEDPDLMWIRTDIRFKNMTR